MKNELVNPRSRSLLRAATIALATLAAPRAGIAAPRTVHFLVPATCICAQCTFEVHRALAKFEGVQKTSLSTRDHRLDIVFAEGKQPLSALALALGRLDLGRDNTLLWPIPKGTDLAKAAEALGQVPGVRSTQADAKGHAVRLTFDSRKDSPSTTIAQLDNVLKGLHP